MWNEAGAAIDFTIDSAYYQTRWFQAICLALLLAAMWALYRYRLQQVAREFNVRLDRLIEIAESQVKEAERRDVVCRTLSATFAEAAVACANILNK